MTDTTTGVLLCIAAGVVSGSFTLPMKFMRGWAWENTWFVWTACALIALPIAAAMLTLPNLGEIYADAGAGIVAAVAVLGSGWGVSQMLFGLAVKQVGMTIAFSVVTGMSVVLGSAVPLMSLPAGQILSPRGLGTLSGVALVVAAMGICALAGRRREAEQSGTTMQHKPRYRYGLLLTLGSGLGAAAINFAIAFGAPLLESAQRHGSDPLWATNAIWLPLMLAGAVPNLAFCAYLMHRNDTGGCFAGARTLLNWLRATVMAGCWFGSISLYGLAVGKLGSWGATLGWPLFTSLIVITASGCGIVAGEWGRAGWGSMRTQICGMSVLIVAVFVLATAIQPA
ncbi:L-rhamnose/proton symporter RhaT [Bradyrhizobium sp. SZCCHNRI1029]|uniref:L-rhamnose/proton symporter RhaT n=1 Tax=Bradyrhizobium sp. SZCCHNRI1029 TaxID=3057278 RepID=UPI0029166E21|nr:L-rhamnose/proton symporter RhaT [Bradyrhizobium sp. SZCCHNRI1029]